MNGHPWSLITPSRRPFEIREGLRVAERQVAVGSLRFWNSAGNFAATARGLMGCALPDTGEARLTDAGYMLVWRSPTETLLLECLEPPEGSDNTGGLPIVAPDGRSVELEATTGALSTIAAGCADATDGCLVDQTCGISAFVANGARAMQLLSRLGSAHVPGVGQCHVGRIADLAVCIFSIREDETWLLVERVYAAHLRGWIQAIVADLSFGPVF
jgi:hypothetical protein